MPLVSQSEFARHRGVSAPYVNKLVRNGQLPLVNGKIDLQAANKALDERAAERAALRPSPTEGRDPSHKKYANLESRRINGEKSHTKMAPYAQVRLQREFYQAQLKKAEYQKLRGQLLDREDVLQALMSTYIAIRGSLDKIPGKLCARCRGIADEAIGAALENLSESLADQAKLDARERNASQENADDR